VQNLLIPALGALHDSMERNPVPPQCSSGPDVSLEAPITWSNSSQDCCITSSG
jgi:hypothetical protein